MILESWAACGDWHKGPDGIRPAGFQGDGGGEAVSIVCGAESTSIWPKL